MMRQRGVTLISLMVGLIISMVAVLGMLALYKTAVQVTSESARYARVTGDRAAAILQADAVLQNMGFGLESARLSSTAVSCQGIKTNQATYAFDQCSSATPDQPTSVLLWRFVTPGPPHLQIAGALKNRSSLMAVLIRQILSLVRMSV